MNLVHRRLLPLYISTFLERSVFWYALEKVFMDELGFDASIGVAIAYMYAINMVLEVPSGILADKWSRKGTALVALFSLLLATTGGALSTTPMHFMIVLTFWGIYGAMTSGTKQAIVYDTVLEMENSDANFTKYYGIQNICEGVSLTLGSLLASGIILFLPIEAVFYCSIPAVVLGIVALFFLQEPKLHKKEEASLFSQTKQTIDEAIRQPQLYILLAVLVLSYTLMRLISEYAQLWWLPLTSSLALIAILGSMGESSRWVAGHFGDRMNNTRLVFLGCTAAVASFLLLFTNLYLVTIAIVVLLIISFIFSIAFAEKLNKHLSSEVRAGAISMVSLLANIAAIILLVAFGFILKNVSMFAASWIAIAVATFLAACVIKSIQDEKQ